MTTTKMMLLLLAVAAVPADAVPVASRQSGGAGKESLTTIPMYTFKQDCWQKRPVRGVRRGSLAQMKAGDIKKLLPGAGMDPKSIEPFTTVMKDGFFEVDCVKDYLLEHGDAFGSNKHDYRLQDRANVSIVRYNDIILKEDRSPMTREVCFEFCRTVPDMAFFGIAHGRDCYCTPYFKMMAGDSSDCDAVCEGATTTMCGGMQKSSVFEMHTCADTAAELSEAKDKAQQLAKYLGGLLGEADKYVSGLTGSAENLQAALGNAGDPAASNLMQGAKQASGALEKKLTALKKEHEGLVGLNKEAEGMGEVGKDAEKITAAEALTDKLEEKAAQTEAAAEELKDLLGDFAGGGLSEEGGAASFAQYKPITYFVDKEFLEVPSTCGGTAVGMPVVGLPKEACAEACDSKPGECVGFSFFLTKKPSVCILLSKLTSTTYYTGCGKGNALLQVPQQNGFLQAANNTGSADDTKVGCYAKFQEFEGLSLKPNPSGKCKHCLKKATNADRCFD